jgi:hypothetical protein
MFDEGGAEMMIRKRWNFEYMNRQDEKAIMARQHWLPDVGVGFSQSVKGTIPACHLGRLADPR